MIKNKIKMNLQNAILIFTEEMEYTDTLRLAHSIQLIDIVKFLYKNYIIHRDIRPPIVMFGNDNNLRLIGFGFAYKFKENEMR
ncbi:unnamed protein product [Rotaria magnacalcarata]|uniref:Protein kinase domain-containing protein n=3 Tax=Rotaria magnacalcarata TaxID=392030 RepID=A0A819VCB7_9BILA|nr:unnamed protein product [Rotaria magnacalcarata]